MEFLSTRGGAKKVSASQAISFGIAEDGGLYVPADFPLLSEKDFEDLLEMDYAERCAFVLSKYLTDYDYENLKNACMAAYAKFDDQPANLVKLDDGMYILELFHGPTLAFKDMALTVLPHLLREGCDNSGIEENVLILVATSGDTGKAALEGFKNAPGIKIMVFYPSEGVSDMQKLQMSTQEGENVRVVAVDGNFDDCQTAVKKIFTDKDCVAALKEKNYVLSSANSINFGRLAPQIAYYISAYCDLVGSEEIEMGDKVNFSVPTGNFGNILAAYYAKQMGLPVNKLVCASNKNNILTDFFTTGVYDVDREFYKTSSPSMDILISSNLERLIFELTGRDADKTREKMVSLKEKGYYDISKKEVLELSKTFYANFCDEKETFDTIYNFNDEYDYPLDPHTAVAVAVHNSYICEKHDDTPTVIVSTASPFKFPSAVYEALTGSVVNDAFKAAKKLSFDTGLPIPDNIADLKDKEVRFTEVKEADELFEAVMDFIK